MQKMKEFGMKIGSVLLSGVMVLSLLTGMPFNNMNKVEAATLSNPSKNSNGVVTWDCVYFGKYPQSDATGVTKDPIKWRVLSVDGNDAFLMADCNLDAQQYHYKDELTAWSTCTLRSWLNGYSYTYNSANKSYSTNNFIDKAFSESEQNAIKTTSLIPNVGDATQDKLFLLSFAEVTNEKYGFASDTAGDKARERVNTAYVAAGGTYAQSSGYTKEEGKTNWWWLLDLYESYPNTAYWVGLEGELEYPDDAIGYSGLHDDGYVETGMYAICPALHLDISQSNLWFYAGTVSSDGTCEEVAYPTKTLSSISAKKTQTTYEVGETLNVDDITVTAVYSTGEELTVEGFNTDVTGIDMTTEGTKEILISYTEGDVTETTTVEITVTKPAKELMALKVEKTQTTYEVGDVLNLDDITLTALYNTGDELPVEEYDVDVTGIDMTIAGTKEILISYTEGTVTKTATIEIEVTQATGTTPEGPEEVKELTAVKAEKVKTAYEVGEELNVDDITVTAVYSTGEETKVTVYETNADSMDMATEGTKEILISYTEGTVTKTTTIEITVTKPAKELTAIKAEKVKTAYEVGETLNVDDITVTAVYSTGEELTVEGFSTDVTGIDMTTEGTKEILISYTEGDVTETTTVEITVTKPAKELMALKVEKTQTTYEVGEELNVDDITVTAVYSTGEETKVTVYETNADSMDMATEGTKELLISYTEGTVTKTATIEIEVTQAAEINPEGPEEVKELTAVKAEKVKIAYEVGEKLSVEDLTVTATYSNGETSEVTVYETNADSIDMETEGTKELLITYTERDVTKTTTVEIEVTKPFGTIPGEKEEPENPEEPDVSEDDNSEQTYDVSLVRIKAEKEKVTYEEGEKLALDDLKVTAVYSDGAQAVVTAYTTNASEIDMTKAGVKELIVTYKEDDVKKTAIVSIEVVERFDEEEDDEVQEDDTVYISKIAITGISKKIAAGKKVKLTAQVMPSDASNSKVLWTSSNKKYATVNQKGQVTLKQKGIGKNVTITAKATDGSGVKATYTIRIMKHAVKKLAIKGKKVQTVKAGRSIKLKTTIKTTGKSVNKTLQWTSSNIKYATVSNNGKVKAKKAGKGKQVKITAMSTDGSNKKATVTIKIK